MCAVHLAGVWGGVQSSALADSYVSDAAARTHVSNMKGLCYVEILNPYHSNVTSSDMILAPEPLQMTFACIESQTTACTDATGKVL